MTLNINQYPDVTKYITYIKKCDMYLVYKVSFSIMNCIMNYNILAKSVLLSTCCCKAKSAKLKAQNFISVALMVWE